MVRPDLRGASPHEDRHPSRVQRHHREVLVWQHLHHPFDAGRRAHASSSATSAIRSSPASRSWSTPVAASSGSTAATAPAARRAELPPSVPPPGPAGRDPRFSQRTMTDTSCSSIDRSRRRLQLLRSSSARSCVTTSAIGRRSSRGVRPWCGAARARRMGAARRAARASARRRARLGDQEPRGRAAERAHRRMGPGVLARRAAQVHLSHRRVVRRRPDAPPGGAEPLLEPPPARDGASRVRRPDRRRRSGAARRARRGVRRGAGPGGVPRRRPYPTPASVALEVGVGVHDREAFAIIHGDVPTLDALADVVRQVTAVRSTGRAPPSAQPVGRGTLAALAARTASPRSSVPTSLSPAEPPVPAAEREGRGAVHRDRRHGTANEIAVVCSIGVDLDVMAYAADAAAAVAGPPLSRCRGEISCR